jgi:hypothetical protein
MFNLDRIGDVALKDWKRHPGGGLAINPIVGYETAAMTDGAAGMLRVEFALDPTMQKSDAVQLVATARQLEDLILALRDLADNLAVNVASDRPPGKLS